MIHVFLSSSQYPVISKILFLSSFLPSIAPENSTRRLLAGTDMKTRHLLAGTDMKRAYGVK